MAGKGQDSGEKTELPTPKRLRDARKKGDVAKSKDMGAAALTVGWLLMLFFAGGAVGGRILEFASGSITRATQGDFPAALANLGWAAATLVAGLTAMLLVPLALLGTVAEFLQIGPVLTGEKLKLSFDKMNPVEGLKRMFGKDGLVELVKTLAKALLVATIALLVFQSVLPEAASLLFLVNGSPTGGTGPAAAAATLDLTRTVTVRLFGWTAAVFVCVAVLDRLWTKHSFIKKMKMSKYDIKKEHKQDEGDPHVKGQRRQLHQEWASSNAVAATAGSAALLVNPTHLAIALDYDALDTPVPVIAAKGDGALAAAMRAEAARAGVPIIRHVGSARRLWARGEVGEIVPEDLFDAIAEIILWAKRARSGSAPMEQELDDGSGRAGHPGTSSAHHRKPVSA